MAPAGHAREAENRLPDGPERAARDKAPAGGDPLVRSGWIYGYAAQTVPLQAAARAPHERHPAHARSVPAVDSSPCRT